MNEFNQSSGPSANDAKQAAQDALGKAKDVASDAKQAADDALDTGKAYAQDAVNAAGRKIDSVASQWTQTTDALTKAINDEPVKAVIIAAAVSSVLTALLVAAMRNNDRYD